MELDQVLNQDSLPVLASMTDNSVDVVITDPPYPNGSGLFTDCLIDGIAGLYLAAKKARKHVIFFWTPLGLPPSPPPGWFHTSTRIWSKTDAKSRHNYELIIVWSRDYRRGAHRIWAVPILEFRTRNEWQETHPTQKPVRLLRYIIEDYTSEGDTILDPFAGTGTTGVAAAQLKRHYVLIESNKEYADFANARLTPRPPPNDATPNDPAPSSTKDADEGATPKTTPKNTPPKAKR